MKIPLILNALGILVAIFLVSGCRYLTNFTGISYPTSYRAFIPKSLDPEYKEFQRLCRENIGKIVYARPMEEKAELEDMLNLSIFSESNATPPDTDIKIGNSITAIIGKVYYDYYYVAGFRYYTHWTKVSDYTSDYIKNIKCRPLILGKDWKEELAIIKEIAFNNKEYIGEDNIIEETISAGISQMFREAIYAKSSHYIGNKELK